MNTDVAHHQNKGDNIGANEIQFGGRSYVRRVAEVNDSEELLIVPTTLLGALQPYSFDDESEGFTSKEAESIYGEVFYFIDEKSIQLPENELIVGLKGSNPDWFE